MLRTTYLFVFLFCIVALYSCKKNKLYTSNDAQLSFSNDSIQFDTVFSTLGSVTKQLLVYNKYNKKIKISNIHLANASGKQFKLNIDGSPVSTATDVVLNAKDSLYIFVQVTIDPKNVNNPFLVKDSIVFETNGNIQDIDLVAYGQDAHYYYCNTKLRGVPRLNIIGQNTTFTNDKPHVIIGGYLAVDSAFTLTIQAGTKLHFGPNAGLWVSPFAALKVQGTKAQPVVFQGIRTDEYYKDQAGQWDRIWLNETYSNINHEIDYAIIKNGFVGLQIEPLQAFTGNKTIINNTIINNCAGWGMLNKTSNVNATNTVVANCAKNAVACINGGNYNFVYCTVANYFTESNKPRKEVALLIDNSGFALDAYFANCIIDGDISNELTVAKNDATQAHNFVFENCMLKTTATIANSANYINAFTGTANFKETKAAKLNLKLSANSSATGKASSTLSKTTITLPLLDIDEVTRANPASVGAYEYQP
jgi:hypothetical protein